MAVGVARNTHSHGRPQQNEVHMRTSFFTFDYTQPRNCMALTTRSMATM